MWNSRSSGQSAGLDAITTGQAANAWSTSPSFEALGGSWGGGAAAAVGSESFIDAGIGALGFFAHRGRGPGDVWDRVPRFHSGRGPGEMAAVIRRDESVLTPGQMRQLAPVAQMDSGGITIINKTSAPIGKVTEQRLSNGDRALIIEEAADRVAAQFGDPNSKVSRAHQRNFNSPRTR